MSAEVLPEPTEYRAMCLDCEWVSKYTFRDRGTAIDRAAIHNRMKHGEASK